MFSFIEVTVNIKMRLQLATVHEDYAVSALSWVKPKPQIEINTSCEKMELHTVLGRVSGEIVSAIPWTSFSWL